MVPFYKARLPALLRMPCGSGSGREFKWILNLRIKWIRAVIGLEVGDAQTRVEGQRGEEVFRF